MAVTLATPVNNVYTTLTSAYVPASRTLAVVNGAPFSAATPSAPIRLTVISAATYGTVNETQSVFLCSGASGGTLTVDIVTTVPDQSTDQPFAAGDIVEVRITAGTIADLNTEVNALQTVGAVIAPTEYTGSCAIDGAVSNAFTVTLTSGTSTLTLQNIQVGQTVRVTTIQPGTPGAITWYSVPGIRWSGGNVGTPSGANKGDIFMFYSPATGVITGGTAIANF